MNNCINIDFSQIDCNAAKAEQESHDLEKDIAFVDESFCKAASLLSDELWDGCMSRGIKKIEKGSQRISFQHFRTPGINSKLISYRDSENGFSVLFVKSIFKHDEGFSVMQAFKMPDSPNQPVDIIYPFSSVDKPKASAVAFLKKMAEKGILSNFLLQ